jgi:hypothetical protein
VVFCESNRGLCLTGESVYGVPIPREDGEREGSVLAFNSIRFTSPGFVGLAGLDVEPSVTGNKEDKSRRRLGVPSSTPMAGFGGVEGRTGDCVLRRPFDFAIRQA